MKTWVKIWLFFLNLVLLGSLAFLYDPIGRAAALAYVAAVFILMSIVVAQRGLTRLCGLGHLIAWVPLMAYLFLRLGSEAAGPQLTFSSDPRLFAYAVVFVSAIGLCLVMDVIDVLRWIRGERYVLGTEEAFRAGASKWTITRPAKTELI